MSFPADKKTARGLIHTIRQNSHRLLSLLLRRGDPNSDIESSQRVREYDAESNKRTTPSANEDIKMCCIWAVEFYSPSHIDALLTGVQRFGWNGEGFHDFRDIEEWVDKSGKLSPSVGNGWLNLGFVRSSQSPFGPPGTNALTANEVHQDALPPNHVTGVTGRLISISSSLSCVIVGFFLEDGYAKKLDSALRTDRQTFSKSTSRIRTTYDPESQKVDDIRQIRGEIKGIVTKWFSINIPGLFSSGLLGGEMPTCEFIVLREAEPFPNQGTPEPFFLRPLDLAFPYDAWASTDLPGLKVSFWEGLGSSPSYHFILSLKESDSSDSQEEETKKHSAKENHISTVDMYLVDGPLYLRALLWMLEGYGNHLRAIRSSTTLRPESRRNSVTILDNLASNVSFSIDIDAVTSELQSFAEPESRVRLRLPTFEPIESQWYPKGYTLAESLCSAIAKRASWIQKMDRSLRDHGTQYGALVGALENVRLQRQIKYFTIALTALTIVLLSETSSVQIFLKELYKWLQGIWVFLRGLGM